MGIASWPLTVSSRRSTCHGCCLLWTKSTPCQSPTGSVSVFTVHERLTSCLIQASPMAYSIQPVVLIRLLVAHHKTGLEQGVDLRPSRSSSVVGRQEGSVALPSSAAQPTRISEEPSLRTVPTRHCERGQTRLNVALVVLDYVRTLIWPVLLLAVLRIFYGPIARILAGANRISIKALGVEGLIEGATQALERSVDATARALGPAPAPRHQTERQGEDRRAAAPTPQERTAAVDEAGRREAIERLLADAANWGWQVAQLGWERQPEITVTWDPDGRPHLGLTSATTRRPAGTRWPPRPWPGRCRSSPARSTSPSTESAPEGVSTTSAPVALGGSRCWTPPSCRRRSARTRVSWLPTWQAAPRLSFVPSRMSRTRRSLAPPLRQR